MQVSLLVGHSQPGPSQPLSHTQAPLEQRPRSGVRAGITWAAGLCHSPNPACGSLGVHRGCKQTPQHPPRVPAAHHWPLNPLCQRQQCRTPCLCHQAQHVPQLGSSGGLWGFSHRCRGSRRCVGTAGRRTRRRSHQSAGSGPRSSTGTSRTGTRPSPSTAPRPRGGCRLRCWGMTPGSSHKCPLAWGQRWC